MVIESSVDSLHIYMWIETSDDLSILIPFIKQ